MSRTVTALYTTREEAERAVGALRAEVALAHAEIYDRSSGSASGLDQVDLTPEERAACETKLATGEYMLLAQVRSGEDPDHIITILERISAQQSLGGSDRFAGEGHDRPAGTFESDFDRGDQSGRDVGGRGALSEERLPVVEEELRVGTREVVRGGARVRTRVEDVPVHQEVELVEEHATIERRPATRTVSEQELEQGNLLRERVIEVAQIREEAVVTKEAFVREEVLVKKSVERRVEQIHDTVRRTEVETERMEPGDDPERTEDSPGFFR